MFLYVKLSLPISAATPEPFGARRARIGANHRETDHPRAMRGFAFAPFVVQTFAPFVVQTFAPFVVQTFVPFALQTFAPFVLQTPVPALRPGPGHTRKIERIRRGTTTEAHREAYFLAGQVVRLEQYAAAQCPARRRRPRPAHR